jgi:hypothetical protein
MGGASVRYLLIDHALTLVHPYIGPFVRRVTRRMLRLSVSTRDNKEQNPPRTGLFVRGMIPASSSGPMHVI